MKFSLSSLVVVLFSLLSSNAYAVSPVQVKWTYEVGLVVKPTAISAGEPLVGLRMMTFTYEAQRACKRLSVFGHSYSPDGVQLAAFMLTQHGRSSGAEIPG